jgi:hypothetical protein
MAIPAAVKAAATVVTNPKLLKIIGGIILGVIIMIIAPIAVLIGVINAGQQIDWNSSELRQTMVDNMSSEQNAQMQAIEDTMNAIETAMTDVGHSGRVREAQVIYSTALFEQTQSDPNFITTLVDCFDGDPDDAELIRRVNEAFGVSISLDEFRKIMSVVKNTTIDVSGFIDTTTKNPADLVAWARMALDAHWGYVWGTYGQVLTRNYLAALIETYPDEVGGYEDFIRSNWLSGRTADCNGLIKSYGWYDTATGEIAYGLGGVPDLGANSLYSTATVNGSMDTMPDTPGLGVWHDGHVGIYVGNDEVIEAMGTKYGVVKTTLPSARWTAWFEISWIDYTAPATPTPTPTP